MEEVISDPILKKTKRSGFSFFFKPRNTWAFLLYMCKAVPCFSLMNTETKLWIRFSLDCYWILQGSRY